MLLLVCSQDSKSDRFYGLHGDKDHCIQKVFVFFLQTNQTATIMAAYTINVNGTDHSVEVDSDTPILWVLRDTLGLVGTKYGCGIGQCGACTIHLDGSAARSCSLPIASAVDKKITTIEGLSADGSHPVQQAWIKHDVPQCGYCQAGQIMTAAALLDSNSSPSETEIEQTMHANICRCGTYNRIKAAVKTAADATK